jgi:hypothetical protein
MSLSELKLTFQMWLVFMGENDLTDIHMYILIL